MRVLTVRQPWAWAIIHGGKDVENRVRNIAGAYRGPVAIHAAQAVDTSADEAIHRDLRFRTLSDALAATNKWRRETADAYFARGVIIGVVDLVDVHHAAECVYVGSAVEDFDGNFVSQEVTYCSAWAEDANVYHLTMAKPRPIADPIPYQGALGLRTLDEATCIAVWEAIA
ncbi:hypothetical protein ACFVR6_03780 [Microbacterium sp. NPDC058021]|uniref:hypothetical protein n=1 Tax=Microbacterium sp. NPDC058021 TaxID=3346306 RepID=UPI0036DE4E46